jgi:hypothetical protein
MEIEGVGGLPQDKDPELSVFPERLFKMIDFIRFRTVNRPVDIAT